MKVGTIPLDELVGLTVRTPTAVERAEMLGALAALQARQDAGETLTAEEITTTLDAFPPLRELLSAVGSALTVPAALPALVVSVRRLLDATDQTGAPVIASRPSVLPAGPSVPRRDPAEEAAWDLIRKS